MKEEITDSELKEFCQWHKAHYGKSECFVSAMTTCLCGHYHTYPREATLLLDRCIRLGLMEKKKNMLYLK